MTSLVPTKPHVANRLLSTAVFAFVALLVIAESTTAGGSDLPAIEPGSRRADAIASQTYGKLLMSFEPNQGQVDRRVKFLSRGNGYNILLTPDEVLLILGSGPAQNVVRMKFANTSPTRRIIALEELPGKVHYYRGSDPGKWQTNIPTYRKVKVPDIYPGVDLIFYGNQRQLEYDLIVAPGADPSAIKFLLEGAEELRVDPEGDLVGRIGSGELRLKKPRMYQDGDGSRREIRGGYAVGETRASRRRSGRSQIIAFRTDAYDESRPLVIDPMLVYSTYLGGSGFEVEGLNGIAVDSSGSVYLTGYTNSLNFPTTSGVLQSASGGNFDVFVSKLNASGNALLYSTYLGGTANDAVNAIAIDASGNAFLTGSTESANFPTTAGALQTTYTGVQDAFISKLDSSGGALLYSTYLGHGGVGTGSGVETGTAIAVDDTGNAYVAGLTSSPGFPTANSFPNNGVGLCNLFGPVTNVRYCWNAFVTKLNPSGSALVYSTQFGAKLADDQARDVAVDSSGNAYVTGYTCGTGVSTTGAFQPSLGGACDAFVLKVNTPGNTLGYSTYLGGGQSDAGNGIAVSANGNAFVTGTTSSSNFPVQSAFRSNLSGSNDAFVTQLAATGSTLVYSTYLGGTVPGTSPTNPEAGRDIEVDGGGNVYVTGFTETRDFPTFLPIQANSGDSIDCSTCGDAFVTKLNSVGNALSFSTYLGGSGADTAEAIALGSSGDIYIAGSTSSTNFPVASAYQGTSGGNRDAFVSRISLAVPRGDVNGDGVLSVADVFYLINFLFAAGAPPVGSGDENNDGMVTTADVLYLISYLFAGGPPP